jgi:hypothetical protein
MRIAMMLAVLLVGCGVEGPQGPEGDRGPSGPVGPAGSSGQSVTSSSLCIRVTAGANFYYQVTAYSDGAKLVTCEISDAGNTFGSTRYWRAGTVGASQDFCSLVYDIDTFSSGYWEFINRVVTYRDVGSASNGVGFTYAAGECN